MRERKYRAWNIIVRRFQYFTLPDLEKQDGPIQWHILKIDDNTGLENKDEVEIYEGDILVIQLPMGGFWGYTKRIETGVVKYEADHAGFIVQWKPSRHQNYVRLDCDIAWTAEVIGNIHQNPELIQ